MKTLFIVSTYPSSRKHLETLSDCIDGIKQNGHDVLIVSHLQIPQDIVNKVEYCIYDYNNTFLPPQYSPFFWYKTPSVELEIYNAGHPLPICRNMKTGINMAKALGYDYFVFTESDVIFSKKDISQLEYLLFWMEQNNKKMLFFRPEQYRGTNNSYVYETLLFAGQTDFFINTFSPPIDLTEWMNNGMAYTLEQTFYEKFAFGESEYIIINEHSSEYFTTSKVNVNRYGLFNVEMLGNMTNEEEPTLFINNSLIEVCTKYIYVYENEELYMYLNLSNGQYWFKQYNFDGRSIRVMVYDDEDKHYLSFEKTFVLNPDNKNLFATKGKLKFI